MVQLGGFLGKIFGTLLKTDFPLRENVLNIAVGSGRVFFMRM